MIFCLFFNIGGIFNIKHNPPESIFQSAEEIANNTSNTSSIVQDDVSSPSLDDQDIKMLYPTKENGRVWFASWSNNKERTLASGKKDPFDLEFVARGNGKVFIDGHGLARLVGDAPRMYVVDPDRNKKWNNVEVTIYSKRISEIATLSSQGIVIGARSEHQDATLENPCLGATYYGRLLYDGRAVFQKEVIHEGSYSVNKPKENNKAVWDTPDGTLPKNVWIGVKFIVKTNADGQSVKLELYRDLTDGYQGGTWEKVAEYTDVGNWAQVDSGVDVQAVCGYSADRILLEAGTAVFVRNDKIKSAEYKLFSIREIE